METVEIGIDDLGSSGFSGTGIELLMNDKPAAKSANVDVGDLNALENELNDLTIDAPAPTGINETYPTIEPIDDKEFNLESNDVDDIEPTDSRLGSATANFFSQPTGFVPPTMNQPIVPRMNEREARRKKRTMLKKLDEWREKGLIKESQVSLESSFEEIEDEYETALEDKRRKDSVKLQGWWLMTAVNSMEYANNTLNPFGVNLEGWGDQVNEDIDSYEDLFAEIYEKYKNTKMNPVVSIIMRLGFSAAVVGFTNKALGSAVPGFGDVMRQNPDLMKAFQDATINTMSNSSPEFAMANDLMGDRPRGPPPPAPIETKTQRSTRPQTRPDISHAESGIELDGVGKVDAPAPVRREMRGPKTDIDDLLSGLKTKKVDIKQKGDSVVSAASVADMGEGKAPTRTQKRKQKSDRSIALDI